MATHKARHTADEVTRTHVGNFEPGWEGELEGEFLAWAEIYLPGLFVRLTGVPGVPPAEVGPSGERTKPAATKKK